MSNLDDIITYYKNLLIYQYSNCEKANATIGALAENAGMNNLPFDLERAFDIDSAIGDQLTILGKYVGVPRNIYGLSINPSYLELITYSTTIYNGRIGLRTYEDDPTPGYWLTYDTWNTGSFILDDASLRILIKLKIILNNIKSTFKNLIESLYSLFGSDVVITDNKDMTITMTYASWLSIPIQAALYLDIIPVPAGVYFEAVQV